MQLFTVTLLLLSLVGCKTANLDGKNSKLRDATLTDKESLPAVKFAYWADEEYVYRGYCIWSSAPFDRTSCTENLVRLPVKEFQAYFQKLEIMPDGYPDSVAKHTPEQRLKATNELLTALQQHKDLVWVPMQRRIPAEYRGQIKLTDDAALIATRLNQCFLGMANAKAMMPPFMVSVYELVGRGALKIGIREGLGKGQNIIVSDGKIIKTSDKYLDLYKEVAMTDGARIPTCQLYNSSSIALPSKTILFASGWDRQNPKDSDITSFRLYKDAKLQQETGYMSCVGAFSEFNGSPTATFPLGELLGTLKNESAVIVQGYIE